MTINNRIIVKDIKQLNVSEKWYYYLVVITTIIVFSPSKSIPYILPLTFLVIFSLVNPSIISKLIFFVLLFIITFFVYKISYFDIFSEQNYIIGFFTYSTFYLLLFISNNKINNEQLLLKIIKFLDYIFLIEGFIGIIQACYGFFKNKSFDLSNGDHVEGTIHLALESEKSFANPMFFSNMAIILILKLLVYYRYKYPLGIGFLVGLFSMILASVLHSIIFLTIAFTVSFIAIKPKISLDNNRGKTYKVLKLLIIIGSISFFTYKFLFNNFYSAIDIIKESKSNSENPRKKVISDYYKIISITYPQTNFIGLGLGQFCSRASLLGSGKYLGLHKENNSKKNVILSIQSNELSKRFVIEKVIETADNQYYGSSQRPFFSIFSILSELGLLISLYLFIYFLRTLSNIYKYRKSKNYYAFFCFSGCLYIFLLGFQENYYEIPQAILLPCLILKLIYSIIVSKTKINPLLLNNKNIAKYEE